MYAREKIFCLMMAVTGLTALAACSGSDSVEPEPLPTLQTAISFAGNMEEEQAVTRATGVSLSEKATAFTVWGYKNMSYAAGVYDDLQEVFPGYTVRWQDNSAATTTTNSNGWEYVLLDPAGQTIKYWDWDAAAYRFFAVTGYDAHAPNEPDGPHTFSINADATNTAATPYYSHLWFSTGAPETYPTRQFGRPVVLEFLKPYARVRFMFMFTFPREGIILSDVELKPTADGSKIVRKGTVTVSYPIKGASTKESFSMTPDADPGTHLSAFTEDYDPEDDSKVYEQTDNGWYMVLPNQTQGSYTLSLKVNGADKSCAVPAEYMQWLPGYSYTYIFKITDEGGVEIGWVESAVTPWTNMEADRTVYNW